MLMLRWVRKGSEERKVKVSAEGFRAVADGFGRFRNAVEPTHIPKRGRWTAPSLFSGGGDA